MEESKPVTKRIHLSQSIVGPLVGWNDKQWRDALKWMTKNDGSKFATVQDLRREFCNELAQGHLVVPVGECDNFDFRTGCKGHAIEEGEVTK